MDAESSTVSISLPSFVLIAHDIGRRARRCVLTGEASVTDCAGITHVLPSVARTVQTMRSSRTTAMRPARAGSTRPSSRDPPRQGTAHVKDPTTEPGMVCKPLIVRHLPIVVLQLPLVGQRVPTDNISLARRRGWAQSSGQLGPVASAAMAVGGPMTEPNNDGIIPFGTRAVGSRQDTGWRPAARCSTPDTGDRRDER